MDVLYLYRSKLKKKKNSSVEINFNEVFVCVLKKMSFNLLRSIYINRWRIGV